MGNVREITRNDKVIFIVDHSDCKESEMINNIHELKERVLARNQPVMLISIYNDKSYVTPAYMRVAESATAEAIHLVTRHAVVGLNAVKKMILKGYNYRFRREVPDFPEVESALKFLLK